MRTRFFRSRKVELVFQSPQAASARGLFFDLSLGLEGPLDEDSGMILNLVRVDEILNQVEAHLAHQKWVQEEECLRSLFSVLDSSFHQFPLTKWIEISLAREGTAWAFSSADRSKLLVTTRSRAEIPGRPHSREKVFEETMGFGEAVRSFESRPGSQIALIRKKSSV